MKNIKQEELDIINGGLNSCGLASLGPLNQQQGLRAAEIAWADARQRGMSARQFNSMGWRKYSELHCDSGLSSGGPGRGPTRRFSNGSRFRTGTPGGRWVPDED
jgi:hypothetical protein